MLPQEVWEDSCFRRNGMGGFLLPQEVWEDSCFRRRYGRILASAGGMGGFLLPQEWYGRIPASASGMGGFLLPQVVWEDFCFRRNGMPNFRAGSQFYGVESKSMILPWAQAYPLGKRTGLKSVSWF